MPWPNLSTHLTTHLAAHAIPAALALHIKKTLESLHLLCAKIITDHRHRHLHRSSREKALIEVFDSLLRKCAVLLRALNEMPGDVDGRGDFKDEKLMVFGDRVEDVVDLVEAMQGCRGDWVEVLRREKGKDEEVKEDKEKEMDAEGKVDGDIGERKRQKAKIAKENCTRYEGLWAVQQKYEDEVVRLAEEVRVAVWRLLAGEECTKIEKKKDGEGEDGRARSGYGVKESGSEDSGFFEHTDSFFEENLGDMDSKSMR